jgi:hypothetical protein
VNSSEKAGTADLQKYGYDIFIPRMGKNKQA